MMARAAESLDEFVIAALFMRMVGEGSAPPLWFTSSPR